MKQKTKIQLNYIFQNCLMKSKDKEKVKNDYQELLKLVENHQKKMKL